MKINNFKNLLDKIIKSEAINHTYQIFIYKSALRIFKSYKFHFLHKILMLFLFNKIIILKLLIWKKKALLENLFWALLDFKEKIKIICLFWSQRVMQIDFILVKRFQQII